MAARTQAIIDAIWDFRDAAASEGRFRRVASALPEGAHRREIETQLARALGLQGKYDEAEAVLDGVAGASAGVSEDASVQVRELLERGRLKNSSGDRDAARELFRRALELGERHGLDGLAVDAAHMLAIADPDRASAWNGRAMEMCERGRDEVARRWEASLLNNMGWDAHGRGEFAAALELFERALSARVERGQPREIEVALWCVARCLRSLGRCGEALEILTDLRYGMAEEDGYVFEELGECLLAIGRVDQARPHFARAAMLLEGELAGDPLRLRRMQRLGRSDSSD